MANRVVIDPVTRIEGHLRVEVEVKDGKVVDAYSSGTMVRGIEIILKGRDPRDAWAFTERVCGVCTTVHALASVRTVEDALGIAVPPNAELIRNLMFCAQYMQDHVVHFYHLHALDWVDVVSALKADPKKTSELAQSISNWPKSSPGYFADLQKRLTAFVESGQLGHLRQRLLGPLRLQAAAGGEPAWRWRTTSRRSSGRRRWSRSTRCSAARTRTRTTWWAARRVPSTSTRATRINAERLAFVGKLFEEGQEFVEQVYLPDLLAVASFYKDWGAVGGGLTNYMAYGDLPTHGYRDPSRFKFPRGVDPEPRT